MREKYYFLRGQRLKNLCRFCLVGILYFLCCLIAKLFPGRLMGDLFVWRETKLFLKNFYNKIWQHFRTYLLIAREEWKTIELRKELKKFDGIFDNFWIFFSLTMESMQRIPTTKIYVFLRNDQNFFCRNKLHDKGKKTFLDICRY